MSRRPTRTVAPARRNRHRLPRLEALEGRALLATYSVTTAADSGAGSLRAAIQAANGDNQIGADSIAFAIGSGPATIALHSPLPSIGRTVVIDGESQPGYVGVPLITLDGSAAGAGADGLDLAGSTGSTIRGLAIVNFRSTAAGAGGRGIVLNDGGSDRVIASYIGINRDGQTPGPNDYGIAVYSPSNTIGGLTGAARNLISGNAQDGIVLYGSGATENIVEGNFIGTDVSGAYTVGNAYGVALTASNNVIGGTTAGAGNVISGNIGNGTNGAGLLFTGTATGNVVQGNNIGLGPVGNEAQQGNVYGIYFGTPNPTASTPPDNFAGTTIGGTTAGAGNAISGNFTAITGTLISGLIAGNKIGTDVGGTTAIPNSEGIFLNATNVTIGGTVAAARNVIAGTSGDQPGNRPDPGAGINLSGAGDVVEGNYLGLDASGNKVLGNRIGATFHVTGSTIGGTAAGAGNVVGGNAGDGLRFDAQPGNLIAGNFIGVNSAGTALANGGNGIFFNIPAPTSTTTGNLALNDTVGSTAAGAGNVIASNKLAGVAVAPKAEPLSGLGIRGNSIYANGRLGIDRSGAGTPSAGYLFLTGASTSGSTLTVAGVFDGTPGQAVAIDLFASVAADPSGYGQGRTFLGTVTVTPGPTGLAQFSGQFVAPPAGRSVITGTTTYSDGNTTDFTQVYPAPAALGTTNLVLTGSASANSASVNAALTFTETITNTGAATANGVILRSALPISLANAAIARTGSGGSSGTVSNGNIAAISIGSLAPGASATVIITGTAAQVGTLIVAAGVSSTTLDTDYTNNIASQSVAINPAPSTSADLAIVASAAPVPATKGGAVTYVLLVTNNGPGVATNVRVNNFLPTGATLVSVTPTQGATPVVNGTLITDNLGTIQAGATASIRVVVTATAAGTLTDAANVSGDQMDPIVSNNATSASTTVAANVSFSLSQTFTPSIGAIGQYQTFVVTARNLGTDPATNVTLIDALPAGSAFVFATPSQGGLASLSNNVLTNNFGTIAAGGTATLTVVVLPTTFTTLINYAGVYSPDLPTVNPAFAYGAVAVPSGPSVVGVVGTNGNRQLIATFDEPLNQSTATNRSNYRIVDLGTTPRAVTARDRPLAITSAVYIPQTSAVVITPATGLVSTHYYALTIVGSTPGGIADTRGRRLINVRGGTPGANFNATFLAGSLPQG